MKPQSEIEQQLPVGIGYRGLYRISTSNTLKIIATLVAIHALLALLL